MKPDLDNLKAVALTISPEKMLELSKSFDQRDKKTAYPSVFSLHSSPT